MSIRSHINRTVGLAVAGGLGVVVGGGFAAHAAFAPIQTQQVSDVSTPTDTASTPTVEPSPSTTSPEPTVTVAPKPSASPTSTYVPPATTTTTQEPTVPAQPEPTQPAATQPQTGEDSIKRYPISNTPGAPEWQLPQPPRFIPNTTPPAPPAPIAPEATTN